MVEFLSTQHSVKIHLLYFGHDIQHTEMTDLILAYLKTA